MKSKIFMEKAAFSTQIFSPEADLYLKNKLVKCCSLSIALYGADTWILRERKRWYLPYTRPRRPKPLAICIWVV